MGIYSHSKLESFRSCPRKYYYRHVAKVRLESAPEQIATFLGSRVHETLEHLYRQTTRGVVPSHQDLLGHFRSGWKEHWTKDVVLPDDGVTAAQYRGIAEKCLTDYYNRHTPFGQSRVISLEHKVYFPLDNKRKHFLRGYIDRLCTRPDGTWEIHDYKTNSRLPTQADRDADSQLAFYELGIRQMWRGIERVELIWHFLRFDQQIVSRRSPDQLQELKAQTLETIVDIEARKADEKAFPIRESGLCKYCEFQSVCPAYKHLHAVQALPANKFLKQPGVKLVNRWSHLEAARQSLREQQRKLDEEIELIKAALLAIAEAEELSTIVGTEKEVAIKREQRPTFPRKGQEPEAAELLEATLRKSRWWKQVSSLDRATLARMWGAPDSLDAELRKILKEYVFYEDAAQLRLRQRKE